MTDENGNKVSLEKHLTTLIEERTHRFGERIASLEKATIVAKEQMEKRLEGMNEFRDTLKDQAAKFITREELKAELSAIEKGRKDNTAFVISCIGIFIAIVSLLIKVM